MASKFPPALALNKAIQKVKDIYDVHSGDRFNSKLIVDTLETTETSSNFIRRITALQAFGLIDKSSGDTIQLTNLAIQIANPVAGEDAEAKLICFKKIDVLEELLKRFPNAKIPTEPTQVKQILLKSLNIHRDGIEQWYDFVVNSFRAISGTTTQAQQNQPIRRIDQESLPGVEKITQHMSDIKYENFYLPSKSKFEFSLPENVNTEDLDFIIGFFTLKKNAIKQ